jgi:predicted Zn-dependent peptidase
MLEKKLSSISHQIVCDGLSDVECLRIDIATVKTNLDLLLDSINSLMEIDELDQSIFKAEYPVILGASDLALDPYDLVLETARKSVFKGTHFEHPPDGYRYEIESITFDDCNKAWQFVRNECRSVLGLYGDIEKCDSHFDHGTKTTPAIQGLEKNSTVELNAGIVGAECCHGKLVTDCDPDLVDFLVYIIGGSRYGLLYSVMREDTGLAYDTRAIVNHYTAGSLVRLYFGIDDKTKLQKSCDTLKDALFRFEIDSESLNFQKESYKCKLLFEMDNPERFLAKSTYQQMIGLEPDPTEIFAKLDGYDTQAIKAMIKKVFDIDSFLLVRII